MAIPPNGPQYDPQLLLNSQPVIITVIDPLTHKVVFQNQTSHNKFGDISNLTCHEKIASCATPCAFCKMPEAVDSGKTTASEVPLPNDEYLLVQWAKPWLVDGIAAFSVMTHFESIQKGVLDSRDILFFLSVIVFSLFSTSVIVRAHRAG